ncbi:MAG: FAD-dependent oxidoreductase, partial [Thermocladium sp.]
MARRTSSAGLLLTEYTYINAVDSRGSPNELGLYSDEVVPKFYRLVDAVHSRGSKIFVQLVHAGRKTKSSMIWGNKPIAPSPIPIMEPVQEMGINDIKRVINEFGNAASRAEAAGFDGVEIHGAHGYLVAQFLSPATNKRRDEYGDGVLFLEEVLREVRRRVSIPVGLRISATEFDPDGLNPQLVSSIIGRVGELLDYVHLSAGRDGPLGSTMPFYWRRPAFIDIAKQVNKAGVLLFLVGSVVTMRDAEEVLEIADAVVVGRQLLADPDWLPKALRNEAFRPCIRCNQSCRGFLTREVRCDVNPELGWETIPLRKGSGRVTVIGGGLMGMEAALTLARRGFSVTLLEKSEKLGGQLNWVLDPWKKEFLGIISFYERELSRLGVDVQLNTEGHRDEGIWAVPHETQPPFTPISGKTILIDSNLYAYQDYAFRWAEDNRVMVTERSLASLDRARAHLLREAYEKVGVIMVKDEAEADVVMRRFVKN